MVCGERGRDLGANGASNGAKRAGAAGGRGGAAGGAGVGTGDGAGGGTQAAAESASGFQSELLPMEDIIAPRALRVRGAGTVSVSGGDAAERALARGVERAGDARGVDGAGRGGRQQRTKWLQDAKVPRKRLKPYATEQRSMPRRSGRARRKKIFSIQAELELVKAPLRRAHSAEFGWRGAREATFGSWLKRGAGEAGHGRGGRAGAEGAGMARRWRRRGGSAAVVTVSSATGKPV